MFKKNHELEQTERQLLSLCFPIYNRLDSFRYTFTRFLDQLIKLNSFKIEVIVSLNPSKEVFEETKDFLFEMKQRYDFVLNINETNIGGSNNIIKAISLAHGKYVWVIGDDDLVLDGCVLRVLKIIEKYPDVGWIYLAYARINGFPNDETTTVGEVNNYQLKGGYYKNGKETAIRTHNKIGGHMLFSSSNIFLREVYEEIRATDVSVEPQLGASFASAARGAVYLDNKVGIMAGGCISWGDKQDYNETIRYFKDMLSCVGHGLTKNEVNGMIRYRMRHDALSLWFRIYRLVLKGNAYGRQSFSFFFCMMPVQTILTLILSPAIAAYLLFRHQIRNKQRKKSCIDYLHSPNPDKMIISRIKV